MVEYTALLEQKAMPASTKDGSWRDGRVDEGGGLENR